MVTAESVTDEQIRELRRSLEQACAKAGRIAYRGITSDIAYCNDALAGFTTSPKKRRELKAARARCAEILNARAKESK